jgi:hypothetical protein
VIGPVMLETYLVKTGGSSGMAKPASKACAR